MKNYERAHYTPDSIKDRMVTGSGNDDSRFANMRDVTDRTESTGSITFPYMEGEFGDMNEANKAPYPTVEFANIQQRRDDEELARIAERIEEIGNPSILQFGIKKELGQLAARKAAIDPDGSLEKKHKDYRDNNLDLLIANAKAHAAHKGGGSKAA